MENPVSIFPLGNFSLDTFAIFAWGFSLKHVSLETLVWELSLDNFGLGALAWELSLRYFRLETLDWELPFGNFRLGTCTFAWGISLENFRLGILAPGSQAWGTGLLRLGEPLAVDGGTGGDLLP